MSRLEWLVELGRELDKIPAEIRVKNYLTHKYGEVFFVVPEALPLSGGAVFVKYPCFPPP